MGDSLAGRSSLQEVVVGLARKYVCNQGIVVDIGTGSGGSIRLITEACGDPGRILGLDVDCSRLLRARERLAGTGWASLVCGNASRAPLASSSAGAVSLVMTLHEVEEGLVDGVLREAWRILTPRGILLFVDRVLFKPKSPAEELVLLAEDAYHKAVEYALGVRLWGLRKSEEYLARIEEAGFKLLEKAGARGRWIEGSLFLKSWGRDTVRLASHVADEARRRELEALVERIKRQGARHGYGPAYYVVAVFKKHAAADKG